MTRFRSSTAELRSVAIADLTDALRSVGLSSTGSDRTGLSIDLDGAEIGVDVVPISYATATRALALTDADTAGSGRIPVVVSDRITADARAAFEVHRISWLDRRGHLRLVGPGLFVDAPVPSPLGESGTPATPLRGRAGLAVAFRLLAHPQVPVSPTRSGLGFAPSTVSDAVSRLRRADLVDEGGLPVTPELFWEAAAAWSPQRTWLAAEPPPQTSDVHGWCVSGTVAAAELGAPVVSTTSAPDLYVPGPVIVTIAARRFGVAPDPGAAAASIAVAPVAALSDADNQWRPVHQQWPLAHPVAVALDLAQDRARGREILDGWSPDERVW